MQSGDDGTADQGARQTRGHRDSGVPQDWHRDSSSRRRSDEDASHHELAQVGNIPGHHTEATNVKQAQRAAGNRKNMDRLWSVPTVCKPLGDITHAFTAVFGGLKLADPRITTDPRGLTETQTRPAVSTAAVPGHSAALCAAEAQAAFDRKLSHNRQEIPHLRNQGISPPCLDSRGATALCCQSNIAVCSRDRVQRAVLLNPSSPLPSSSSHLTEETTTTDDDIASLASQPPSSLQPSSL